MDLRAALPVVEALERAGIEVALGGSGLLAILDGEVDVRDVDLTTDAEPAAVRAALHEAGLVAVEREAGDAPFATRLRLALDGGVDVIVGFGAMDGSERVPLPTRVTGRRHGLPLGDPAVWARAYALLGRTERAAAMAAIARRPLYDDIGSGYTRRRRADPRIAAHIERALGDAESVLNVGAGTGSYEPRGRRVTALEPSRGMRDQRPPGAAPVVAGRAEELPFADGAFDAVMAIFSDHHWGDRARGLAELRRVARGPVVLLNWNSSTTRPFWLNDEYLPAFMTLVPAPMRVAGAWERELGRHLGSVDVEPVPVAHDCSDGFYGAYWRRPEAYLDPEVRASISVFAQIDSEAGIARLADDLESGRWHARHADLLERDELDLGYVLAVSGGTG